MKPETLDPVIELRDAISLMLGASERMALLDEEGRIAVINPAWREHAREHSPSIAAVGRGASFLDLCDRAAAQGEHDAAELSAAIRRVLGRQTAWARVPLSPSSRYGLAAASTASVRRVRGPLENWLLVAYSAASVDTTRPTALPELGVTLGSGLSRAEVLAEMDAVTSHVALLDGAGRIVAVNAAWRRFAERQGATAEATGVGADYLTVCEAAVRSGDYRGAQFAEGLRSVLAGSRKSWWLDSRVNVAGEIRLFRGRVTRVESPDGPFVIVAHTDLSTSGTLSAAA
jgi:hypothetical protein